MPKSLYIFVTSERPDQYLNSIIHCFLHESVRKVVFLYIRGFGGNPPGSYDVNKGLSLSVFRKVQSLLELLSQGTYRYFVGQKTGEMVSLQQLYQPTDYALLKNTYKQCLDADIRWEYTDIDYLNLRDELAQIHKKEPDSMFDVTAIRKSYLGDIVACCIVEGIHSLYTFDLKIDPNFDEPWTMLIHELRTDDKEQSRYQYADIVDTPVFKACSKSVLVRTPPIKISLLLAAIFLLVLLVVYFYSGETNRLIQGAFIVAAIASLLSVYFAFFPPRR